MKVIVNNQSGKTVRVNTQGTSEVVAVGIQGPSGSAGYYLNNAQDVDISSLQNGSILVYKADESMWKATKNLEEQNLEGGQY